MPMVLGLLAITLFTVAPSHASWNAKFWQSAAGMHGAWGALAHNFLCNNK